MIPPIKQNQQLPFIPEWNLEASEKNIGLTELFQKIVQADEEPELAANPFQNFTRMVVVKRLQEHKLKTEANLKRVMDHADPDILSCAVCDLSAMNILDQQLFEVILAHPKADYVAQILFQLHHYGILSAETRELTLDHSSPEYLLPLVNWLRHFQILTLENFRGVATHKLPTTLAVCFSLLEKALFLTEVSLTKFIGNKGLTHLLSLMNLLETVGILTEENIAFTLQNIDEINQKFKALKILVDEKLLNEKNYFSIALIVIPQFDRLLKYLKDHALLNLETLKILMECKKPHSLISALPQLIAWDVETITNVAAHSDPEALATAIRYLYDAQMHDSKFRTMIVNHRNPISFAKALISLQQNNILTDENVKLATLHRCPESLVEAILRLSGQECLTEESLNWVFEHKEPLNCAQAIIDCLNSEIFTQKRMTVIAKHRNPLHLLAALIYSHEHNILKPEYESAIASHAYPIEMAKALEVLDSPRLVNNENLALLAKSNFPLELAKGIFIMAKAGLSNRSYLLRWSPAMTDAAEALFRKKLFDREALKWLFADQVDHPVAVSELNTDHDILNEENFQAIRRHASPVNMASAIVGLHENPELIDKMHLVAKHESPYQLFEAFIHLRQIAIPDELYEVLAACEGDPLTLAKIWVLLHGANILTAENLEIVSRCPLRKELLSGLKLLHHLLVEVNVRQAAKNPKPKSYCQALVRLDSFENVTDEIRSLIDNHATPFDLALIFQYLDEQDLLTEERAKAASLHPKLGLLSRVLYELSVNDLITADSWKETVEHPDLNNYLSILEILHENQILNEITCKLAATHSNPVELQYAVTELSKMGLLTLENFLLIADFQNPVDALALIN